MGRSPELFRRHDCHDGAIQPELPRPAVVMHRPTYPCRPCTPLPSSRFYRSSVVFLRVLVEASPLFRRVVRAVRHEASWRSLLPAARRLVGPLLLLASSGEVTLALAILLREF